MFNANKYETLILIKEFIQLVVGPIVENIIFKEISNKIICTQAAIKIPCLKLPTFGGVGAIINDNQEIIGRN